MHGHPQMYRLLFVAVISVQLLWPPYPLETSISECRGRGHAVVHVLKGTSFLAAPDSITIKVPTRMELPIFSPNLMTILHIEAISLNQRKTIRE